MKKSVIILCIVSSLLVGFLLAILIKINSQPRSSYGNKDTESETIPYVSEVCTEPGAADLSIGEEAKFINNDLFLTSVPKKFIKAFNKSVDNDLLLTYTNCTFERYDSKTHNIYAYDDALGYSITFEYNAKLNSYSMLSQAR